jgi:DNA-binding MarR family transcriptional regulator
MTKSIGEVIKQNKFESNFQKALINLIYTTNYIRDYHSTIFTEFGLQSQHFNVLRILKGKHPRNVQPGYIKDVMIDKGCDLSRLLDKLELMGHVTRATDPLNKRNRNVNLTASGLSLIKKMSKKLNAEDSQLKNNMTEDEYLTLSNLLDKMRG